MKIFKRILKAFFVPCNGHVEEPADCCQAATPIRERYVEPKIFWTRSATTYLPRDAEARAQSLGLKLGWTEDGWYVYTPDYTSLGYVTREIGRINDLFGYRLPWKYDRSEVSEDLYYTMRASEGHVSG